MTDNIKVGLVRVDQIRFHPHNVRQDLGDLRALSESILRYGVMQPIVVERYGSELRIRAGHRRLAAAKIINLYRVPAIIHDAALDDENWLVHAVQENVMRRGLDDNERRRAILGLRDLGCTWDGIGQTFGVTAATVRAWTAPAEVAKPRPRPPAKIKRPRVADVEAFCDSWRAEVTYRDVAASELLDALTELLHPAQTEGAVAA